jgi:uncharacterized protein YcfJ
MKKLTVIALVLAASTAFAQQNITNYLPNAAERTPDGATGPGIVYTNRVLGKVIAVGSAIVQNFPVAQNCNPAQYQPQPQQSSSLNMGTFIGGVAGAIIGNQVGGKGAGKEVATAIGATTGALVGNNMNQQMQQPQGGAYQNGQCQTTFEQRIVGYNFIVQYQSLQMQGTMNRLPRIGDEVEVIIRSTFYAGS